MLHYLRRWVLRLFLRPSFIPGTLQVPGTLQPSNLVGTHSCPVPSVWQPRPTQSVGDAGLWSGEWHRRAALVPTCDSRSLHSVTHVAAPGSWLLLVPVPLVSPGMVLGSFRWPDTQGRWCCHVSHWDSRAPSFRALSGSPRWCILVVRAFFLEHFLLKRTMKHLCLGAGLSVLLMLLCLPSWKVHVSPWKAQPSRLAHRFTWNNLSAAAELEWLTGAGQRLPLSHPARVSPLLSPPLSPILDAAGKLPLSSGLTSALWEIMFMVH